MVQRLAALALAAQILAACATTGPGAESWCELNEPRRHSHEVVAAMSEEELEKLNAHNRYGELNCGWRP